MTYQISSQIPIFVKPSTLMKNMTPQFYGVIMSGMVHTGVEVHRIDLEMCGLVE